MQNRKAKRKGVMSALGMYLERRMEEENVTQLALEEATGIPDATISRVRRGVTRRPDPSVVVALSKFFKEDPIFWLTLASYPQGNMDGASAAEQEALAQIRALPHGKEIIARLAELTPRNQAVIRQMIGSLREAGSEDQPPEE